MPPHKRLSREQRREELIALGLRLFGDRPIEEFAVDVIAEAAGISRGLLYHYFGDKEDFRLAVMQRMTEDLVVAMAPIEDPDPIVRLRVSLEQYVAFAREHRAAHESFLQAARGGSSPEIRRIYEEARAALTGRIFDPARASDLATLGIVDSPLARTLADGWAAMVQDVVLGWLNDTSTAAEAQILDTLTAALAAALAAATRDGSGGVRSGGSPAPAT